MSTLTTLDGLAEGTDIAVQVTPGGPVQRWAMTSDGGLLRNGQRLDPWFLSGLLAQGRVHDGDFSPARPGEWFTWERGVQLVVEVADGTTHVAQFRSTGVLYRWSAEQDLIEQGVQRCDRPGWVGTGDAFFRMTSLAWKQERAAADWRQKAHNVSRARDYLRYVVEYTNSAVGLLP